MILEDAAIIDEIDREAMLIVLAEIKEKTTPLTPESGCFENGTLIAVLADFVINTLKSAKSERREIPS